MAARARPVPGKATHTGQQRGAASTGTASRGDEAGTPCRRSLPPPAWSRGDMGEAVKHLTREKTLRGTAARGSISVHFPHERPRDGRPMHCAQQPLRRLARDTCRDRHPSRHAVSGVSTDVASATQTGDARPRHHTPVIQLLTRSLEPRPNKARHTPPLHMECAFQYAPPDGGTHNRSPQPRSCNSSRCSSCTEHFRDRESPYHHLRPGTHLTSLPQKRSHQPPTTTPSTSRAQRIVQPWPLPAELNRTVRNS